MVVEVSATGAVETVERIGGTDTIGVACGNVPALVITCPSLACTLAGVVFAVDTFGVVEAFVGHTSDLVMVLAMVVRAFSVMVAGSSYGALFCAHLWMRLLNATNIPAISAYPSPVAMYPVIAGAKIR